MKLLLYTDALVEAPADLIAVGVFSDEPDRGLVFARLNRALDGALEHACRDEDFKGERGQSVLFSSGSTLAARRVLVYGYGERRSFTAEAAREFSGAAARAAQKAGAASIALALSTPEHPAAPDRLIGVVQALAEGALLGAYAFNTYKTKSPERASLEEVRVAFSAEDVRGLKGAALRDALLRGRVVAEAVNVARDLVNEPPNTLHPVAISEACRKMAKSVDLDIKVLTPKDMERHGMGLLLGVGAGSINEPRLVHMTYAPENLPEDAPTVALVGKGITFDSGGLSLKPADSMVDMKCDMGGAAAVFGAMRAISALEPQCRVHGIIAAAENMPGGRAIRPGDVLKSKKGLTVEVMNTDAEGRLVLADAIAYALEQKPTDMIDLATLTGACMVALGKDIAGAFAKDPEMGDALKAAWERSGEKFWPMPLDGPMREQLKSDVADIKNLGERWGGAITAALFLNDFVGDDCQRWAHLDIAGPVMSGKAAGHIPKGATGFAVRTLVEYVCGLGAQPATDA